MHAPRLRAVVDSYDELEGRADVLAHRVREADGVDVRVGLCGWTVSQAAYVRRFPVVEVQHTFYEPPADAVLASWRAHVPA